MAPCFQVAGELGLETASTDTGGRRSSAAMRASSFRPHGDTGKRYLLDQIPAGLWADVKAKCKRDGISIRALILQLLTEWVSK